MIKKISYYFLFLLAFSIYAAEEQVPLISNAEELKNVKARKIVWQKDKLKRLKSIRNLEELLIY